MVEPQAMDRPKTALVVASNRAEQLKRFLDAWWHPPWDIMIVVEDAPVTTFDFVWTWIKHAGIVGELISWSEIDGNPNWIEPARSVCISRRDSGIKCYGFHRAIHTWDAKVVITLDDDCLPLRGAGATDDERRAFVDDHRAALVGGARWVPSIPGFPTRGLPYTWNGLGRAGPTHIHMGTWANVPDLDAPQSLAAYRRNDGVLAHDPYTPPPGIRLMHPDQYWPCSGMNLSFVAEALPLMYFPKMGADVPYARFDDIWAGIVAQKCCKHLGWRMSAGDPAVQHVRASNPMVNLVKEAPGLAANEWFWRAIDAIPLTSAEKTALDCMETIGAELIDHLRIDIIGPVLVDYLPKLGDWILDWCKLLNNATGVL
jgi:hypothetical protein